MTILCIWKSNWCISCISLSSTWKCNFYPWRICGLTASLRKRVQLRKKLTVFWHFKISDNFHIFLNLKTKQNMAICTSVGPYSMNCTDLEKADPQSGKFFEIKIIVKRFSCPLKLLLPSHILSYKNQTVMPTTAN